MRKLALAIVFLAAITMALHLGKVRAQAVKGSTTTVTVNGMAAAVDALVARYGYVITLEEPPLVYEGDFEDMPVELRRDMDRYRGSVAPPKVLVPRSTSLTLTLPAGASIATRDLAGILRQLVQQQSTHGIGAHYHLEQAGDIFHLVPTEIRDRRGNWSVQASIFAAPISLPQEERSVIDTVNAICSAVGMQAHTPVRLLMAPMSMLNYSRSTVGANNEPASIVLTRALTGMNRKLTWRVGYFAQMSSYLLIITVIPDNAPASTTASSSVETSSAVQTPTAGPGSVLPSNPH